MILKTNGFPTVPLSVLATLSVASPVQPASTSQKVLFGGRYSGRGRSSYGALDDTQYSQFNIAAEETIAYNPYLFNVSQLAISNWTSNRTSLSPSRSNALAMNMTRIIDEALCSDNSDINGAAFTHGTNFEETAIPFDLLIHCDKSVVARCLAASVGPLGRW
ncbi:hypothetical protein QQZ08_010410 [Neonectria magnoliae]|uniref:Uncharacterized protein n=1 Tax=Neonectria magnoliae TaxID=2732573 RepID=A0ABR1HI63_9HYPO